MYEYVKPQWMPRARPKINDKQFENFGDNLPPRPVNPLLNIDNDSIPRYQMLSLLY